MNARTVARVFADRDLGDEATVVAYCEYKGHDVDLFAQQHVDGLDVIEVVPDQSLSEYVGLIVVEHCEECLDLAGERAEQRAFEDYHGGSNPQTAAERYQADAEAARRLK